MLISIQMPDELTATSISLKCRQMNSSEKSLMRWVAIKPEARHPKAMIGCSLKTFMRIIAETNTKKVFLSDSFALLNQQLIFDDKWTIFDLSERSLLWTEIYIFYPMVEIQPFQDTHKPHECHSLRKVNHLQPVKSKSWSLHATWFLVKFWTVFWVWCPSKWFDLEQLVDKNKEAYGIGPDLDPKPEDAYQSNQ